MEQETSIEPSHKTKNSTPLNKEIEVFIYYFIFILNVITKTLYIKNYNLKLIRLKEYSTQGTSIKLESGTETVEAHMDFILSLLNIFYAFIH